MDTYCKTCGAPDSVLQTLDNACCDECGDIEGLVWRDDETDEEWEALIGDN